MERVLWGIDLSDPTNRFFADFAIFATSFLASLRSAQSSFGRASITIPENEKRAGMSGLGVSGRKIGAVFLSKKYFINFLYGYDLLFRFFGIASA
ncbi:hypothetical protein [Shimia sp.]|uniref:hypothetical protein n=1 Tax=Shimia sp. TaxID=1954381 RepID=UPI00329897E9